MRSDGESLDEGPLSNSEGLKFKRDAPRGNQTVVKKHATRKLEEAPLAKQDLNVEHMTIKTGGGGFGPVSRKVEITSEQRRKVAFRKDVGNYRLRESRTNSQEPIAETQEDRDLKFFIVKSREDRRKEEEARS